jgi:hypothetical protein
MSSALRALSPCLRVPLAALTHPLPSRGAQSLLKFEEAVRDLEQAATIDPDSAIIKERLKKAQVELRKSKRVDYYKVLGVSEVRAAPHPPSALHAATSSLETTQQAHCLF